MNKGEHRIVYGIAIILSVTLILMITRTLLTKTYISFFWYCYTALLLVIIGLFMKNSKIILSQLVILAIPDLLWMIDFISLIFTGHAFLGITQDFYKLSAFEKITSLQHFYTVPLIVYALSFLKIKKDYKILLVSLGEIILIFLLTISISNTLSINCINEGCIGINVKISFLPYYLEWFIVMFGFAAISYLIITNLSFIKRKKN